MIIMITITITITIVMIIMTIAIIITITVIITSLCYALLRFATPCYALLRLATLCYALLTLLYYAMPFWCYIASNEALSSDSQLRYAGFMLLINVIVLYIKGNVIIETIRIVVTTTMVVVVLIALNHKTLILKRKP